MKFVMPLWNDMNSVTRSILQRMADEGLQHDSAETDHARKWLNLEDPTAEAIVVLLRIARVRNLLEIGTSNGYSTIWLASALASQNGKITTIERDPEKQAIARENLAAAGLLPWVDLHLGDATAIAAQVQGPFDCLFFDGDRISAPAQLDILLPKLSRPALLLADNALSHPDQIAAHLDRVSGLPYVSHVILPVGKGLSVAHLPEC